MTIGMLLAVNGTDDVSGSAAGPVGASAGMPAIILTGAAAEALLPAEEDFDLGRSPAAAPAPDPDCDADLGLLSPAGPHHAGAPFIAF